MMALGVGDENTFGAKKKYRVLRGLLYSRTMHISGNRQAPLLSFPLFERVGEETSYL